jgi:uncharacterized membrane protein
MAERSPARPLHALAGRLRTEPVRGLLQGRWLGHPLHPMLTDLPIGFWTSSFTLDLVGGRRSQAAADQLLLFGLLTTVPTAAAGVADWGDLDGERQRDGAVHAYVNLSATALYALSYLARRRHRRGVGIALGLAGATAATVGGYLGGHLAFPDGPGPP